MGSTLLLNNPEEYLTFVYGLRDGILHYIVNTKIIKKILKNGHFQQK